MKTGAGHKIPIKLTRARIEQFIARCLTDKPKEVCLVKVNDSLATHDLMIGNVRGGVPMGTYTNKITVLELQKDARYAAKP